MTGNDHCVVCGSQNLEAFYQAQNVPVSIGNLWATRREAVACRKGDVSLALCQNCGIITNTAFDPSLIDYSQAYDNSLDFSHVFQEYARALAGRLIDTHHLFRKRVVEIGCGKGEFLSLLCELGDNQGVGYDPSHDSQANSADCSSKVRIVPRVYSNESDNAPADFICCRHVLEHIANPREFLLALRSSIGSKHDTGVYFEVPNMMHTLHGSSLWTIIYEHCAYYGATALAHVFESAGFEVRRLSEDFEGEFLGIEAYPRINGAPKRNDDASAARELAECAVAFGKTCDEKLRALHDKLLNVHARRAPVVLWGAGARGVSLLNSLEDATLIHSAVDINPNKHGKFMAGTGHEIVSPQRLRDINPGVVIVMNPVYAAEIATALESLGLQSELVYA